MECFPRRHVPCRTTAGAAKRGRNVRPLASSAAVDEAGHHRGMAGGRSPLAQLRSMGGARPLVHRPMVALARSQDPGANGAGRAGRSMRDAEPGAIPGVVRSQLTSIADERGAFMELWRARATDQLEAPF